MAARARFWTPAPRQPTFSMQSLWYLAGWGIAAGLALALAAAASFSETGSRRLVIALGGSDGTAQKEAVEAAARSRDSISDIAPLVESVRFLAAERERLAARIGNIERHLDELTGSIKAQADSPAGATRPLPQTPDDGAAASVPASPQATQPALSETARQSLEPSGSRSDALPGVLERSSSADASTAEFGVDIGAAANFEGLRQLWASTKATNPVLFEGLYGVVSLRENTRMRTAELRLIVGPLADADAVNRFCAVLAAANRYCQPTGFEGQRLADTDRAIERKSPLKPMQRPRRLFGLFQ